MLEGKNFHGVIVKLIGQTERKINDLQLGQWVIVFTNQGSNEIESPNLVFETGYIIWPE